MKGWQKIFLIAWEEHKIAWRSRRFIGVTLFIALAGLVFLMIYSNIPRTLTIIMVNYFLGKNLGLGAGNADVMQAQVDLFFSMSNIVISFVLLFAALLLGHDSISGGKETRSLRFMLSKVDRRIYLIGKFLSFMLYILIVLVVLYLIMLFYVFFKIGSFEMMNILLSILFFIIYVGAWLSIFMFVSTISRRSSLFLALLVPLLFLLLLLSSLGILSPFHYLSTSMSSFLINSLYLLPFVVVPMIFSSLLIEVIDL